MYTLNETHDPKRCSWVESAQAPAADFPIQNLPFGVFKRHGQEETPRVGVAIGDQILDVGACLQAELFDGAAAQAAERCRAPELNGLLSLGPSAWSALRRQISNLLSTDHQAGAAARRQAEQLLTPMSQAVLLLPATIGDYTDFYASLYHATNVGSMFRPDNPLLPNYKYVPIGYHGRSSSIVVSGTPIRRPYGQTHNDRDGQTRFGPSALLDYEAELGCFVGPGNSLGEPIPIGQASEYIFGVCLLNDWSARDVQKWEYQPLGPFLAKNFATTISPWVVTLEALAPFRCPAFPRPADDPPPLPYLFDPQDQEQGGIAITIEVYLRSQEMRNRSQEPVRLSRGSFADMYWTIGQLLSHHASNGCNLRSGDLLGSGTVSGNSKDSRGCMLELAWRGTEPIDLPSGEQRKFLQDSDEIIMRGYCERPGYARIGLGECSGVILPALESR